MKQFAADEFGKRIDEVLFYIWDPIGVSPNPDARSEYRSYAKKILEMLTEGRDAYAVRKYLAEIESSWLSLPAKEVRINKVVELILAHKDAIENGRS